MPVSVKEVHRAASCAREHHDLCRAICVPHVNSSCAARVRAKIYNRTTFGVHDAQTCAHEPLCTWRFGRPDQTANHKSHNPDSNKRGP